MYAVFLGRTEGAGVPRYGAVLFDLLTALLDSWSLWNAVAGSDEAGMRWRRAYLARTYATGAYRPYETLVAEAAEEVGIAPRLADDLAARYDELRPWPGVASELKQLAAAGIKLGVATNCSEALGGVAATCVGVGFDVVVTAERAGFYKPAPVPYRLALSELGVTPERCLFVAGSAYDLVGASRVGLDIWWHDRIGMAKPAEAPEPLRHTATSPACPASSSRPEKIFTDAPWNVLVMFHIKNGQPDGVRAERLRTAKQQKFQLIRRCFSADISLFRAVILLFPRAL